MSLARKAKRKLREKHNRRRIVIDNGYRPTEKQRAFHAAPHTFKLYGGAMGGGKSRALCEEIFTLALEYPGNVIFLGRRDLTDLKKTTLATLLDEVVPSELIASHNRNEKEIVLINGSKIIYGELKDVESLKSLNIGAFAIDEASEVSEDAFNMLVSRLRLNVPGIKRYGLLATNPAPGWVKRRFIDAPEPDTIFIKALPYDNPYLPDGYVERLKRTLPETWVKRFVEGDWSAFEGQIYPDFDRRIHVVDGFDAPEGARFFASIDYGIASPTAILFLFIDTEGRIFVFDEIYRPQMTVEDISNALKGFGYERFEAVYADPALRAKTREKAGVYISVLDELAMLATPAIPANNDILYGISRVTMMLRPQEAFAHPFEGTRPAPRLYVFRRCVNLINEIEAYRWADIENELAFDRPALKQRDHAVDALRYFIASHMDKEEVVEVKEVFESELTRRLSAHIKLLEERKHASQFDEHMGALY